MIGAMELDAAIQEELIQLIVEQQALVAELRERITMLQEGGARAGLPGGDIRRHSEEIWSANQRSKRRKRKACQLSFVELAKSQR